MPENDICLVEW